MKKRIIQFLTTYFLFVLLFVLQKPLFMVYYHDLYADVSFGDYFSVMWHGLPLDLSLAGYLTAIPGLILIASAWTGFVYTPSHPASLFRIDSIYHGMYLYCRSRAIRFLGIPSRRHPHFLFLLLTQRCYRKRQFLVRFIGNISNVGLCGCFIFYLLYRTDP